MLDIRIEKQRIRQHLARARKANLPATLTLEQWLETVKYFGYICAYCQKLPYEVLEHFVSINKGGGTTLSNCVPACRTCNTMKDHNWKDKIFTGDPDEAFARVKEYLARLADTEAA